MKFLYKIEKGKTAYDGYKKINTNFHILDILTTNLYNKINKWSDVYNAYILSTSYKQKLSEIVNFVEKYESVKTIYNLRKAQWLSPTFLLYPTPLLNFSDTPTNVNTIKTWLNNNYPASLQPKGKIMMVSVPSLTTVLTKKHISSNIILIFRNDENEWNRITNFYNHSDC